MRVTKDKKILKKEEPINSEIQMDDDKRRINMKSNELCFAPDDTIQIRIGL